LQDRLSSQSELALRLKDLIAHGRDPSRSPRQQLLATSRLATEQEGLRILPRATDLEGTKVLVPAALWSFRLRLTPELELIQVLGADLSFAQPFEQVLAPEPVEGPSTVSSASVAEGQARQLFLDSLLLSRVLGARQPVGKLEESIAFGVLGLKSGFDQLGDNAAGARPLRSSKRSNPAGYARGKSHTLSQRPR